MNDTFDATKGAVHTNPLLQRLARIGELSATDVALLAEAQDGHVDVAAGSDLIRAGQGLSHTYVVLSGWLSVHRELRDGRRQVLFIALPGDIVAEFAAFRDVASYSVTALTDCRLATIRPRAFLALTRESAALANALGKNAARDSAILGDHVLRLGRLSALQRHCHLMLELWHRSAETGGVNRGWMPWPLKQSDLADILGLSLVHVNRTMMHLKRTGLVTLERKRLRLNDVPAMEELCGYEATHVTNRAA